MSKQLALENPEKGKGKGKDKGKDKGKAKGKGKGQGGPVVGQENGGWGTGGGGNWGGNDNWGGGNNWGGSAGAGDPWSDFLINQLVTWVGKGGAGGALKGGDGCGLMKGMMSKAVQKGGMGVMNNMGKGGNSNAWQGKGVVKPPNAGGMPREVVAGPVSGMVVEWRGKFGYIKPDVPVDHHDSYKNDGNVFVKAADLKGQSLKMGDSVWFEVYSDASGLGAQKVAVV